MSATPVQLISVSSPRDGQARFGQRCIASPSGFTIAVPQSGQCVGIRNSFVPRRCAPAGPTICGNDVAGALDDDVVALRGSAYG